MKLTNPDLLGKAISDYYQNRFKSPFIIHYSDLEPDEMPIEVFFRDLEEMPEIEKYALSMVSGNILDVGAGAGAHSIVLQENGHQITALEVSKKSCEIMKDRGIEQVICDDIYNLTSGNFDTILMLMNGIGIAKSLENLPKTIEHLNSLLNPGGQILFDSSDLSYLKRKKNKEYFGQMTMRYEYDNSISQWDDWLYIDPYTLIDISRHSELPLEVLIEDDTGLFLSRILKF